MDLIPTFQGFWLSTGPTVDREGAQRLGVGELRTKGEGFGDQTDCD